MNEMNFIQLAHSQFIKISLQTLCIAGLFLSVKAFSTVSENVDLWLTDVNKQLSGHPRVIAASEKVRQQLSLTTSGSQPVYNPDFTADFSQEGSFNNYLIGLSQTIDIYDKRASLRQQALLNKVIAEQQLNSLKQAMIASVLAGFAELEGATANQLLAQQELERLEKLNRRLTENKQKGEVTRVNADLTTLSLAQHLSVLAAADIAVVNAKKNLYTLLPNWQSILACMPVNVWVELQNLVSDSTSDRTENNPDVRIAKAQWMLSQQNITVTRRANKPDPTIGVNSGRNGGVSVLGASISMPLAIRNDYSADIEAAVNGAISDEASYRDAKLIAVEAIKSSQQATLINARRWLQWQTLTNERASRLVSDLQNLLDGGDITISNYITSLQQRAAGIQAGNELKRTYHSSLIQLLMLSGEFEQFISDY